MADQSPLDLLRLQGPDAWNSWRRENPSVRPIFTGADLSGVDLSGVDHSKADLSFAKLSGAHLSEADLSGADLFGADLSGANLIRARLFAANLAMANLEGSRLINCDIYGISAWDLLLSNDTQQSELLINASRRDGTTISFQVDDIEVAQFISLLRTSREPSRQIEKIRKVVDSLGLKAQEVARSLATAPDEASNGATVKPEEKEETVAEGQTDSEQNKARDVDEMKREMRRTIAGLPAQDRNNILT